MKPEKTPVTKPVETASDLSKNLDKKLDAKHLQTDLRKPSISETIIVQTDSTGRRPPPPPPKPFINK